MTIYPHSLQYTAITSALENADHAAPINLRSATITPAGTGVELTLGPERIDGGTHGTLSEAMAWAEAELDGLPTTATVDAEIEVAADLLDEPGVIAQWDVLDQWGLVIDYRPQHVARWSRGASGEVLRLLKVYDTNMQVAMELLGRRKAHRNAGQIAEATYLCVQAGEALAEAIAHRGGYRRGVDYRTSGAGHGLRALCLPLDQVGLQKLSLAEQQQVWEVVDIAMGD